jgi:hypothetical protein
MQSAVRFGAFHASPSLEVKLGRQLLAFGTGETKLFLANRVLIG